MKIHNTKKKNKFLFPLILLLVVSCCIVFVYLFYYTNLFGQKTSEKNVNNSESIDYLPATKEQQEAGNQTKSGNSSDKPTEPESIPGSDKKSVSMIITAANQNDSILQIRVNIGAVENNGTCTLTLSNNNIADMVVTETANIQTLATTSTCQGFDIPISELSPGSWNILVEYSSNTLVGLTTKDITIE